jgi:hypothetical protein
VSNGENKYKKSSPGENPILPKNKSHNSESKISPTIPNFFRSPVTPKNKSHNSESGNIPKK